jgi:hypothetical protein
MIFRKWWQKLRRNPEKAAHWATIVAAVVASFAFLTGTYQSCMTQQAARATLELEGSSQAVDLFVKYNDLMREPSRKDPLYQFWRSNVAVAIAERIFILTRGDQGWEDTVDWMLSQHVQSLKQGFNAKTYHPDFACLVEDHTKKTYMVEECTQNGE